MRVAIARQSLYLFIVSQADQNLKRRQVIGEKDTRNYAQQFGLNLLPH